jgi:hypothetical protein
MGAADATQRKSYFVWLAQHPSEAAALSDVPPDVISRLWADAWRDGGWDAIHRTSELGGLVARLEELISVYRTAAIERELERSSAYWRTEAAETPPSRCELDPDHEFHQHQEAR